MAKLKDSQWFRNTILVLTQPFLPPLGILPTVIHEAAHWLTALIAGVPASEIKIGFHGINPGVTIPSTTPPQSLPYFFYSGGLTAGTILLFIYVFYWIKQYHRIPSATNWIMSLLTVFSITFQLYIGILEGRYHQLYPTYINLFHLLLFVIAAFACHAAIFYFISRYRRKRV